MNTRGIYSIYKTTKYGRKECKCTTCEENTGCSWSCTSECSSHVTYDCDPCDSFLDYSNCLATVETTCKTWESGWTDVDGCDDVSENRQWRMVYRAR